VTVEVNPPLHPANKLTQDRAPGLDCVKRCGGGRGGLWQVFVQEPMGPLPIRIRARSSHNTQVL
jgi:hypothetical protein